MTYATIIYTTAYGAEKEVGPCIVVIATETGLELCRSMRCKDKTDAENFAFDWAETHNVELEWNYQS